MRNYNGIAAYLVDQKNENAGKSTAAPALWQISGRGDAARAPPGAVETAIVSHGKRWACGGSRNANGGRGAPVRVSHRL